MFTGGGVTIAGESIAGKVKSATGDFGDIHTEEVESTLVLF